MSVRPARVVLFDLGQYDYITDDAPAPDTVNPSLWRQSQVIRKGGLYKVTEGLYHGTLHHDVRAVYTKELGMWDGDPVSLHPHTPADSARRYVDLIGADQIIAEGERAFDAGDYRWAAEILHKLVFAQPDNQSARDLQADAYEQLGYQAEGPQWRGIYLTAASTSPRSTSSGTRPSRPTCELTSPSPT